MSNCTDSNADFNCFPKKHSEALALLYVRNQDLKGKSPTEIHELYWKAYREISRDYKKRKRELSDYRNED